MLPTCSKKSKRFHAQSHAPIPQALEVENTSEESEFLLGETRDDVRFEFHCDFCWCVFLWGVKFEKIWKMDRPNKKDLVCHPLSWTLPLKSYLPNRKVVFQPSLFRGYMNPREGIQFTQVIFSPSCNTCLQMFVVSCKILKTALSNKRLINPINTFPGSYLQDVPVQIEKNMRSFQDHFDRKRGTSRRLAPKKGFNLSLENPITWHVVNFRNSMFMI